MRSIFLPVLSLLIIVMSACTQSAQLPTVPPQSPPAEMEPTPSSPPPASPTPTLAPTLTPAATVGSPLPTPTDAEAANPDLDYAQVEFVRATGDGNGNWRFDVTVRHNDQGWDHYADLWQVVDMQGAVLGERVLAHPHDTEQPFTRSQSGIKIPPETTRVTIRAKCNVHGFGGQEIMVDLTATTGVGFEVNQTN
jgi:hypothetical protein